MRKKKPSVVPNGTAHAEHKLAGRHGEDVATGHGAHYFQFAGFRAVAREHHIHAAVRQHAVLGVAFGRAARPEALYVGSQPRRGGNFLLVSLHLAPHCNGSQPLRPQLIPWSCLNTEIATPADWRLGENAEASQAGKRIEPGRCGRHSNPVARPPK